MCKNCTSTSFYRGKYMEIRSFGVGRRLRECERLLSDALAGLSGRLILLPIPTTRDDKYISGTDVSLESTLPLFSADTALIGYNIPRKIALAAAESGASVFDAALDEEFLIENARISANGALGYLLTHISRDILDMKIGIVGYGRIGREMLRLCLLFGGEVRVYTTRESVALELGESGVRAEVISGETDFSELDILINTAPARQIDESRLPPSLEIIDLASGVIFEPSARLTKLSSIPDAFYPETAGRLYAECAQRYLKGWGAL